ncbi:MAG: ABC transporter ATP-binding protein [Patescibacteria group bacterium]
MPFKRIFHYYWLQTKKYKWSFYFTFIIYGLAVVFSNILNPILYKKIIDAVTQKIPSGDLKSDLFFILFEIVIVVVSYQILYRLGDYFIINFQSNVIREIHNDTFKRLMNNSYIFFSNNFSGSLVAKAKRFASSFERLTDIISYNFWFTIVQLAGVFIVLFIQVPKIGLLLFVWSIIYIFITTLFIRKKIKYDLLEAEADSKVTARFSDTISNILNIKIFSGREREKRDFGDTTFDEYKKRKKSGLFGNFESAVQAFLMGTFQLAVLYTMVNLWLDGSISTGMLVLIQTFMFSVFDHLWDFGKSMTNFFKSLSNAKEMVDIFDTVPDILDPQNPETLKIKEGHIVFKNVFFKYNDKQEVLSNFNFEIKPGEGVGLVGHSGVGKSTITKLLLRFNDISEGTITIDGQNIKNITQDDLRSAIAYVPQEPILFHRSIRENIAYSKPDATEEEIINVAKKAHAHEFIIKLPNGYDTKVGERGIKLSGGERQRVAIARAMLKNAPIIVLDEATSSLDSVSESYIHDAFKELMKDKTTLVIAHRLSTVQEMDRIIVLSEGKIAEQGTHGDLLEKKSVYADLWEHQTGGFLK